jgi:flagellar hook-associated protein 1 FlgK
VEGVDRLREVFLDDVYRRQIPNLGRAEVEATFFTRIEDIFQEPSEDGFSARLGRFYDALADFSVNVEEAPVRVGLLSEAESIAAGLGEVAQRVTLLRTNANEEIRNLVPEINTLSGRIAESNAIIRQAELTGRKANDLRDTRDLLIDDLSKLVNIVARERDDGQVDVLLGGAELVTGDSFRALETVPDATIDPTRPDLLLVRFEDNEDAAVITNGELGGTLIMRDQELRRLGERMDEFAQGLIFSMNRIHTQGHGRQGINVELNAANWVDDATAALNTEGLPFAFDDGSFNLLVFDGSENLVDTLNIPIDTTTAGAETTLNDIVAAINTNASGGVTASVNANGALTITPAAGFSFSFDDDSSGVLTALGMNSFFTGNSAATIAVNQHLLENSLLISSGGYHPGEALDPEMLAAGNNSAALAMADLRIQSILSNNTESMDQHFESTIVQVGINARSNLETLAVEQAFVIDFQSRRQEVSGVNLDEEVTAMIQFQRAFEASARIISTVDVMLNTLINMAR